jgi:site-specific recombinase XerD
MANLFFANGVQRVSRDNPSDKSMPIFFDIEHRVIEAPTLWAMAVARKMSRSKATLDQYSGMMQRYLRWLEENGYGSQSWAMVDEDIFVNYIESICTADIQHNTVAGYCARIAFFYKWATRKGYKHFFDLDMADAENVIEVTLTNQRLLAHIKPSLTVTKLNFDTPAGRPALHEVEVEKFVTDKNHKAALGLMDDMVYRIIATIIRITGLRPRDLFQLPYRGKGVNDGFIPYELSELPPVIEKKDIHFYFRSKGKDRSIEFPGVLWRIICELYIPRRRERAEIYYKKHGISPKNDQLFLTEEGRVVNAYMLRYNFAKVVERARALPLDGPNLVFTGRRYNPRMLRHSCATYFVYEHLKKFNQLGRPYRYDPAVDEKLRRILGHEDVETTYKYYVHLVNRFHHDDLLADLKKSHVNQGLNALLDAIGY